MTVALRRLLAVLPLFLSCLLTLGQYRSYPWAIGVGPGIVRYLAHPGEVHATPPPYAPVAEAWLSKYLSPAFLFRVRLAGAPQVSFPFNDGYADQGMMLDMSYSLLFKLDNGVFFREDARIGPYLTAGIGGSYVLDHPDGYVPLGGGVRFRISERFSVQAETVRKLSFNKDYQHIAHAIAFVYNLGGGPEDEQILEELAATPLELLPDQDGDGLPDVQDACPEEAGSQAQQGCPDTMPDDLLPGEDADLAADPIITDMASDLDQDPVYMPEDEPAATYPEEESTSPAADPAVSAPADITDTYSQTSSPASYPPPVQPQASGHTWVGEQMPDYPPATSAEKPVDQMTDAEFWAHIDQVVAALDRQEQGNNPATPTSGCDIPSASANIPPIYFGYASDILTDESRARLDEIANILHTCSTARLVIQGSTDDIGNAEDNLILSVMRAFRVKYYLVHELGVSQSRITSEGLGEIAGAENRDTNRRVSFTLQY
ncbi:MAG: OmpA family protein [Bacteroidia bacterium]|nr:OmpA family protein [Bacteroidia bacterium]